LLTRYIVVALLFFNEATAHVNAAPPPEPNKLSGIDSVSPTAK
jgi:hypothetical protein